MASPAMRRISFLTRLFAEPQIAWAWYPDPTFARWDSGGKADVGFQKREKASVRELVKGGNDKDILDNLDSFSFEEIVALLERGRVGVSVLTAIGTRGNLSRIPIVSKLLCFNKNTPYHVTKGLVGNLGKNDLRALSRAATVPPSLCSDARKLHAHRSKK